VAGIYIHIPFCRQACHYCNFHFSTSLRYKNELIGALLKEVDLFAASSLPLSPEKVETIYFGGGTPSLCTKTELASILQQIKMTFPVDPAAEVTLEANPDDISEVSLPDWKEAGINRLSIGIQSFFEEDLRWMNRAHDAKQAFRSLELATQVFENITIDLIYGTPQLTDEKWKQNVQTALAFKIPHLSCYALTVEPKTPLDKLIREHKSAAVDPGKQSEQFLLLMQWLEEAGYEHYEISNFARPGFRSRHNSSYWKGKSYYGFGPSAHSFDGHSRWWNVSNNNQYIESIDKGLIPFEKEELTATQKANEHIMIALRTAEGIQADTELLKKSKKYIDRGLMMIRNDRLVLTKEGKLLADGIAADLFIDQ
jgi:oxygen-independent coproporphyrinogen-3 oxidase